VGCAYWKSYVQTSYTVYRELDTRSILTLNQAVYDKICEAWHKVSIVCPPGTSPRPEVVLVGFSRGSFTALCFAALWNDRGPLSVNSVSKSDVRREKARIEDLSAQLRSDGVLDSSFRNKYPKGKWDSYGNSPARLAEDYVALHFWQWNFERDMMSQTPSVRERLWRIFKRSVKPAAQVYEALQTFAPSIRVKACGLFDTVSAVDPIGQTVGVGHESSSVFNERNLAFVGGRMPTNVDNVYHAMALLEGRKDFKVLKMRDSNPTRQTLKQVWFYGYHTDIGGDVQSRLLNRMSDITLVWMAQQLREHVRWNWPAIFDRYSPNIQSNRPRN
jgi:uncharacterized protein (DUF2235 family)